MEFEVRYEKLFHEERHLVQREVENYVNWRTCVLDEPNLLECFKEYMQVCISNPDFCFVLQMGRLSKEHPVF